MRPVGAEFVRADRQPEVRTDTMKLTFAFRNFRQAPNHVCEQNAKGTILSYVKEMGGCEKYQNESSTPVCIPSHIFLRWRAQTGQAARW